MMAPEFAAILEPVPMEQRTGWVFAPSAQRGGGSIRRVDTVSSIIVEIGKKAGVKGSEKAKQKQRMRPAMTCDGLSVFAEPCE